LMLTQSIYSFFSLFCIFSNLLIPQVNIRPNNHK
jgi:hypothetical protein